MKNIFIKAVFTLCVLCFINCSSDESPGDVWVVGETESNDFDIPENKGSKDLVLFKLKLTL